LDRHLRHALRLGSGRRLRIHRAQKSANFGRRGIEHLAVDRDPGQQRRRNLQRISGEQRQQRCRQRPSGNRPRRRRAQRHRDLVAPGAKRGDRLGKEIGARFRIGARHQVDQLPPPHRAVVRPPHLGGEDRSEAVVEIHS